MAIARNAGRFRMEIHGAGPSPPIRSGVAPSKTIEIYKIVDMKGAY